MPVVGGGVEGRERGQLDVRVCIPPLTSRLNACCRRGEKRGDSHWQTGSMPVVGGGGGPSLAVHTYVCGQARYLLS